MLFSAIKTRGLAKFAEKSFSLERCSFSRRNLPVTRSGTGKRSCRESYLDACIQVGLSASTLSCTKQLQIPCFRFTSFEHRRIPPPSSSRWWSSSSRCHSALRMSRSYLSSAMLYNSSSPSSPIGRPGQLKFFVS